MNREIKGFGNYLVSKDGTIINTKTGKIKKPSLSNCGYMVVDLYENNNRKTLLVHRIVAESYLENSEMKATVSHKDGDKLNNNASNLEWATYSENHKHSYEKLNRKAYMEGRKGKLNHNSKSIKMFLNGKLIKQFDSIMDAERELGIWNSSICSCLKGKNKTAGGYEWRYCNE